MTLVHVVTKLYYPEQSSTGWYLTGIAEALATEQEVHVVCSQPTYSRRFVGWGGRQQAIERSIRDEHLPSASAHPPCDRDQLSAWLNVGDVATVAFVPGMAGVSVPSRMYNVMAAGRPILAVADGGSELALVVGEEQCGVVTAPDDCDALVRAIATLRASPDAVRRMGDSARRAACTKYSYAEVALVWRQLIRELIDDSIRGSHDAA